MSFITLPSPATQQHSRQNSDSQASTSTIFNLNATAAVFQPFPFFLSSAPFPISPLTTTPPRSPPEQSVQRPRQYQQEVDPCTLVLTGVPRAWKEAIFENVCNQGDQERGICNALRSDLALGIWSCNYTRTKGGEESTNTVFINFLRQNETLLARKLLLAMCPTLHIEQRRLQRSDQRRTPPPQLMEEWKQLLEEDASYVRALRYSIPHWRIVDPACVYLPVAAAATAAPARPFPRHSHPRNSSPDLTIFTTRGIMYDEPN